MKIIVAIGVICFGLFSVNFIKADEISYQHYDPKGNTIPDFFIESFYGGNDPQKIQQLLTSVHPKGQRSAGLYEWTYKVYVHGDHLIVIGFSDPELSSITSIKSYNKAGKLDGFIKEFSNASVMSDRQQMTEVLAYEEYYVNGVLNGYTKEFVGGDGSCWIHPYVDGKLKGMGWDFFAMTDEVTVKQYHEKKTSVYK